MFPKLKDRNHGARPSRCKFAVSRRVGGPLPGSGKTRLRFLSHQNLPEPRVLSAREAPRPSTSQPSSVIGSATDKRAPVGKCRRAAEWRSECRLQTAGEQSLSMLRLQRGRFPEPAPSSLRFSADVEGRGKAWECEGSLNKLPHELAFLTSDRRSHVRHVRPCAAFM